MRRFIPSPAMVVAFAALLLALSGTAVAASLISGSRLKNRSVSAKKIKVNSLGSKEVAETKLKTVRRAKVATVAVSAFTIGGVTLKRIYSLQRIGQNNTPILSFEGLTLFAACPGGKPRVLAQTAVNNTDLRVSAVGPGGNAAAAVGGTSNLDVGKSASALAGKASGTSTIVYTRPDNHTATVTLGFADSPSPGSRKGCTYSGSAIGG
jgi:hypothetical protein